jgi:hypothetical protein
MILNLFVNDRDPKVAAALLRAKARLKLEGRVYVRAHTRVGPVAWFRTGNTAHRFAEKRREAARLDLIKQKQRGVAW